MKQTTFDFFKEDFATDKSKILIVNFSGGRTSGFLTKKILEQRNEWKDVFVIFANTGQEHEKTLEFIDNCDRQFGFNTIWIEADVKENKGEGTKAKVVNYETASRTGKPFEDYIAKYGIPCTIAPSCSRELKEYPIKSFIRDNLKLKKNEYLHAIGIRADESRRISKNAEKEGLVYPLVYWDIDKADILDWWSEQKFDLMIPEHLGNCVWCWKKSYKKLMTIMIDNPEYFDFPETMEKKYPRSGRVAKALNKDMKFFRGFKSVEDIRNMASEGFEKFIDLHHLHISEGCSESCEPFHNELENNLNKIDAINIDN